MGESAERDDFGSSRDVPEFDVASSLAEAKKRPSGEKATDPTEPVWPVNVRNSPPLARRPQA